MPGDRSVMAHIPLILSGLAVFAACGTPEARRTESSNAAAPWHFTDVTEAAGLAGFKHETGARGAFWMPESIGSGVAFVDVDGDGRPDVLAVTGGRLDTLAGGPALAYYRSRGDGTFEDLTTHAGLDAVRGYGQGIHVADYDNDGDADLFITMLRENVLLQNEGGHFRDVTQAAGLTGGDAWSTAAAFLDADRDGDLDLYVGNYVQWSLEADVFCSIDGTRKTYCTPEVYPGAPGRFYRNNGDGTFTDRTDVAGFGGAPGNTLGTVAADYDRDGWTDLFVANDLRPNLLYHNNGDGTFREIGLQAGVAYDERGYARAGMGVDAGIVDRSENLTYFVGNFSREPFDVLQYQGDYSFRSRESASRLLQPSLPSLTFALCLLDLNLDGGLDLFAVNGHVRPDIEEVDPSIRYRQPPQVFLNQGDGTFVDAAPELGPPLTNALAGRGGAFADYDGDGDLDLLVSENGGGLHLWRNDLPANGPREVRLHLIGSRSPRDAVGARVRLFAGERVLEQQQRSGGSYLSTSERVLTFGLGDASEADLLTAARTSSPRRAFARERRAQLALLARMDRTRVPGR